MFDRLAMTNQDLPYIEENKMGWEFKHTHLFRAKVWLDMAAKKILLAEAYGRNKKVLDFSEIKSIQAGTAHSSSNCAIFFTVNDLRKPQYCVEFLTREHRDEWIARLSVALNFQ
jgi:hypothetical protein